MAPAGYTGVFGTYLKDASGNLVANATIYWRPVLSSGMPTAFLAGGDMQGTTTSNAIPALVKGGAFTLDVADTTLTTPVNIGYAVTVIDNETGASLLGPGYGFVQPSGPSWSFDTYKPNLAGQITVQYGPQGLSIVPSGAYSATTTYAQGALVSFTDGSSYISMQGKNIGNTPGSSPTWWMPSALAGTLTGDYSGPLSLSEMTIASLKLTPLAANELGAVWGIADSSGNWVALVLGNGTFLVNNLQSQSSTTLAFGITTLGPLPANTNGLIGPCVADEAGNVVFGIRQPDGKIIGTLANPPEVASVGTATNLHAGTLMPLFGLNLELVLGESTGSGINSLPIVSPTQPWTNLTFSGGIRNGSITSYTLPIPPLTGLTSFIPLIEQQDFVTNAAVLAADPAIATAIFGETSLNGICDRMTSDILSLGVKALFLGSSSALPGAPYSAIAPGTTMYEQMLQIVTAAVSTAGSTYGTVGVLTTTMVFGINDDQGAGNPSFGAEMIAYQAQCQSDIQSITHQTSSIPMVIMQPGRWSVVSPSRAVNGLVTPVIAPQQLAICMEYPTKFLFSTPTYFVPAAPQDGVHFTGPSEQWLGEYYAETKLNYLLGLPSTALIPQTARLVNKTLVIPYSVVNGPLFFDDVQVADTAATIPGSKFGFEVWNSAGAVVDILSAAIGADGRSVVLQLASAPTGGSWGYGWSGVPGAFGGPSTGPRGCLRDSNPAPSFYGHPNMYHWAPHCKFTIS